jgi:hypothetical protein
MKESEHTFYDQYVCQLSFNRTDLDGNDHKGVNAAIVMLCVDLFSFFFSLHVISLVKISRPHN